MSYKLSSSLRKIRQVRQTTLYREYTNICAQIENWMVNCQAHCDKRKRTLQGDSKREKSEIESGRITTPTPQSVSLYAILHTNGSCKGTQSTSHRSTHLAPTSLQFCVRDTQVRQPSLPASERERTKKPEYESTACPFMALRKFWGCIAASSVLFFLLLLFFFFASLRAIWKN